MLGVCGLVGGVVVVTDMEEEQEQQQLLYVFFGFCNYVVAYVHDLIQRIIDEINTELNEL